MVNRAVSTQWVHTQRQIVGGHPYRNFGRSEILFLRGLGFFLPVSKPVVTLEKSKT